MFFLGRKRSQSPSPSRTASPSRSLSPSSNRIRDRSISPLRYINLPVSKLARVTEELESLINPIALTVHEEAEEKEQISTSEQLATPTITNLVKSEESIVLPQLPSTIEEIEEISEPIEPIQTKIYPSEESVVPSQLPTFIPADITPTIIATDEESNKISTIITEVSYSK